MFYSTIYAFSKLGQAYSLYKTMLLIVNVDGYKNT